MMKTNLKSNPKAKPPLFRPIYPTDTCNSHFEKAVTQTPADVWEYVATGWVICWMHHGVFTGKIENKRVRWCGKKMPDHLVWEEHLVELRAFNREREWRLWRSSYGLKGRKRRDTAGAASTMTDTTMLLRAAVAQPARPTGDNSSTMVLLARHYIGVNTPGIAGYTDMRYLDIVPFDSATST